jgi:Tfp pilus assembly protein PilX
MNTTTGYPNHHHGAAKQRGVVLFIALISLVAMTLAAIALIRSVDTATMIAGNLAFKQGTTAIADSGIEAGRTWLIGNAGTAVLNSDQIGFGYYANSMDSKDLTGSMTPSNPLDDVDWEGTNPLLAVKGFTLPTSSLPSTMSDGSYTVSYIIHRLCQVSDEPLSSKCSTYMQTTSSGSTKGGGGIKALSGVQQGHYRITARVKGPRNTVAFVQTIIRL